MLTVFENIEEKTTIAADSKQFAKLVDKVIKSKRVYLIGNGGLHYVASHMSTDMSRLIKDKSTYSFDSVGFITSNANDHGYDKIFIRWLETVSCVDIPEECIVIGLSCSGNSSNVVEALHWADERGYNTFLVSGQKSETLNSSVDELSFECEYFHTVEVATMMLFYELIHQTGNHCPSISGEKERMKDSPLRGKQN